MLGLGIAWIVSRKLRTNVVSSPPSDHDNTALTATTEDDEDPQVCSTNSPAAKSLKTPLSVLHFNPGFRLIFLTQIFHL